MLLVLQYYHHALVEELPIEQLLHTIFGCFDPAAAAPQHQHKNLCLDQASNDDGAKEWPWTEALFMPGPEEVRAKNT